MLITLERDPSRNDWTLGHLSIDGRFFCFTCEDVVRPEGAPKVPGKTAIPAGRYRVMITPSPRFKRDLPLLQGVPNFSGVRIHPGNTHEHTEGCILPGSSYDNTGVKASQAAFDRLFGRILSAQAANEAVWIEISQRGSPRAVEPAQEPAGGTAAALKAAAPGGPAGAAGVEQPAPPPRQAAAEVLAAGDRQGGNG